MRRIQDRYDLNWLQSCAMFSECHLTTKAAPTVVKVTAVEASFATTA